MTGRVGVRARGTCAVCGRPRLALMRFGLVWPHIPMIKMSTSGRTIQYREGGDWCPGGSKLSKEGTLT